MEYKLNTIQQDNNKNISDLDKVHKFTIKINAENLQKKIVEIPILINYLIFDSEGGEGEGG